MIILAEHHYLQSFLHHRSEGKRNFAPILPILPTPNFYYMRRSISVRFSTPSSWWWWRGLGGASLPSSSISCSAQRRNSANGNRIAPRRKTDDEDWRRSAGMRGIAATRRRAGNCLSSLVRALVICKHRINIYTQNEHLERMDVAWRDGPRRQHYVRV